MTARYEPARLNTSGSPHTLPLAPEEGANANLGSVQAALGSPVNGPG
jgi:hypothetical protein